MRNRSFPISKYAFALLCGAFNIHLVDAHEHLDWRYHGNTLDNQRFQDVDQINPHNVARLKPAWIFHTGVLRPKHGDGNDADCGRRRDVCSHRRRRCLRVERHNRQANLGISPNRYAVAVHAPDLLQQRQSRSGVGRREGLCRAARRTPWSPWMRQTGKVVWKTTVDLPSNGAAMTIAPQIADNKVIVGVSGAEFGVRGHLDAYDPDTGQAHLAFLDH